MEDELDLEGSLSGFHICNVNIKINSIQKPSMKLIHHKITSNLDGNHVLRYCMFYGFFGVSRDLEINRLKVRGLFVRRHVRLI
jgi:hypothetical protein